MNGVDLKISPVQGSVRVVMINLAFPLRVLGPLNRQSDAAIGAEFLARVFLPCRKPATVLVSSRLFRVQRIDPRFDDQRRLKMHKDWVLKAKSVGAVEPPNQSSRDRRAEDDD